MKTVLVVIDMIMLYILSFVWKSFYEQQMILQDAYQIGRLLIVLAFWLKSSNWFSQK